MNAAIKIGKDTNSESLIVLKSIAEVLVVSIDAATIATGKTTQNLCEKSEILKPCIILVL
jgi:hypothetical protein